MSEKSSPVATHSWLDAFGTTVSIACAIQYTFFPLMIGVVPLLGLGFLVSDGIEKVFLGSSVILAVSSFTWGFRYHRRFYIFLFLISGLGLIFVGRVGVKENFELPLVGSGALAPCRRASFESSPLPALYRLYSAR